MKITFTELEESEQRYFEEALGTHELSFVHSLDEVMPDTEVLSVFISAHVTDDFLARHPALRLIATRSTTVDHLDLESCARRGVAVAPVASYGDHIVAEHTFALLLALTRRLREAMRLNGDKRFSYGALRGIELHGKTFGILGTGRVGIRAVPIARAFGMQVIAHDIAPQREAAAAFCFEYVSFDELLRRSDVLSLHAPLTGDTLHILDREAFAKCRRGILIINTARGRLIDTAALLEALDSGVVGGAGLDVLGEEAALRRQASHLISDKIIDHLHGEDASAAEERSREIQKLMLIDRLLARPNVVFTPHIAFNCIESIERINAATVTNIVRFLRGTPTGIPAGRIGCPSVKPSDELCLAANNSALRSSTHNPSIHENRRV
ncbi:MAG TPA: NAD(P)-dependent oxidoreductase [Chthoniobacteraceae bacterium]|nr:NAD(P)-dependent oxidoreductase [Chthoniobacteraceae bacterium]